MREMYGDLESRLHSTHYVEFGLSGPVSYTKR